MMESWCFAYDPKTKCPSAQWVGTKLTETNVTLISKVMCRDNVDYFLTVTALHIQRIVASTINGHYHQGVMEWLVKQIQWVCPQIQRVCPQIWAICNFFLLYDNVNLCTIRQLWSSFCKKINDHSAEPTILLAGSIPIKLFSVSRTKITIKKTYFWLDYRHSGECNWGAKSDFTGAILSNHGKDENTGWALGCSQGRQLQIFFFVKWLFQIVHNLNKIFAKSAKNFLKLMFLMNQFRDFWDRPCML